MRPSVCSPTGTVIGPPVSRTSVPRRRPSVVSMATARTRSSPRCCCTSQISLPPPPVPDEMPSASPNCSRSISSALLISGSSSGKTASITTPWISSTRPGLTASPDEPFCDASVSCSCLSVVACSNVCLLLGACGLAEPLGTRDDFHDLLRDLRLALPVGLEREVVDQLGGVLGGVAHGGHTRAVLRCSRLEQRPVDRYLDVVRSQALEDLLGVGLVDPERAAVIGPVARVRAALAISLAVLALVPEDVRLLQREQRLVPDLLRHR